MLTFLAFSALVWTGCSSRASVSSSYQAFREKYRAGEASEVVPYSARQAIYEGRLAEVAAHNARPGVTWFAAINRFADFTEAELASLRGYKRVGGRWTGMVEPAAATSSFLEMQERSIADTVDWRQSLNKSTSPSFIRNQGGCGSCWAVAAVGALEMHAEIAGGKPQMLSHQQLVDCTPNPQHCGGTGGCQGATAELAFQFVKEHGLAGMSHYKGGKNPQCEQPQKSTIRIDGWTRLPENKLNPLLKTLTTKGPVVASVDASGWSFYSKGIFNDCPKDATVNHAVVVVAYTPESYTIRNSWGADWGEDGYIRLQRHDSDSGEKGYCGMDKNPQAGVGCDGGPKEIPVCGMCGVLSDSSYPVGVAIAGPQ